MFKSWAAIGAGFGLMGRRFWSFVLWCAVSAVVARAVEAILVHGVSPLDQALGLPWESIAVMRFVLIGLFLAPVQCAIYRAVLEPDARAWGYLRLGLAEARIAVLAAGYALVVGLMYAATLMLGLTAESFPKLAAIGVIGLAVLSRLALIAPAIFVEGWPGLRSGWRAGEKTYFLLMAIILIPAALLFACDTGLRWGQTAVTVALGDGFVGSTRRAPLEWLQSVLTFLQTILPCVHFTLLYAGQAAVWKRLSDPEVDTAVVEVF
jgi:hypothetical protein